MPKPIPNYSFVAWLEDVMNLPKEVRQRTVAVYFNNKKREYRVVFIAAPGGNPNATLDSTYISAFLEGEETFHDIKGVNLNVDIYDFLRNPTGSTVKILDSAKQQITNLDDIGSERRSDQVEKLVRGNVKKNGKDITDPDNWILGRFKDIGLPLTEMDDIVPKDPTGKRTSAIQLLKPISPGSDNFEDAKVVDEGEGEGKSYKSYRDLASSLTGLSSYMETTGRRNAYRAQVIRDYNRALAEESGIDLDMVLDRNGPKRDTTFNDKTGQWQVKPQKIKGTLHQEVERGVASGNFSEITSNDERFARALGFFKVDSKGNFILDSSGERIGDVDRLNLYDYGTKEYYKRWLRSELNHQGLYDSLETFGSEEIKYTIFENGNPVEKTRRKTLLEIEMGETLSPLVNKKLVGPNGKFENSTYKKNIISQDQIQHSLQAQLTGEINRGSLNKDVTRIASQRGKDPTLARERLKKASKAYEVGNNLFFASTSKEILQQVEQGSFIQAFFITSRGLGLFPHLNKKIGAAGEYSQYLDTVRDYLEGNFYKLPRATGVSKYFGATFQSDNLDAKTIKNPIVRWMGKKGYLDSNIWVEWDKTDAATGAISWTQTRVNTRYAQGLFANDKWGVYDTIKGVWGENGQLFHDLGFDNPAGFDPNILFSDPDKLDEFINNISKAIGQKNELLASTNIFPLPKIEEDFLRLIDAVGLDNVDAQNLFIQNIKRFNDPTKGGKKWLFENLDKHGAFPLDPNKRWAFLLRIDKQGKIDEFSNHFAGYLTQLNRELNGLRTFFYKQVLFGGYAGSNRLIKFAVNNPITKFSRNFLGRLGFSDEIGLAARISKIGIMKRFSTAGRFYSQVGAGNTKLLARVFGRSAYTKIFMSSIGKGLAKSLGYILSGVSGVVTGFVSWGLTSLAEIGWAFGKNALRLNFSQAYRDAKEVIQSKFNVLKKVIIYPIIFSCGCIIMLIALVFMIIAAIVSMFAPLEEMGTGIGNPLESTSTLIDVSKQATRIENQINYTIEITNLSTTESTTISEVNEDHQKIGACLAESSATPEDIPIPVNLSPYSNYTLAPTETLLIEYSITVDNTGSATYSNSFTAIDSEGNRAVDNTVVEINGGGCEICPSGWPIKDGEWIEITQVPFEKGTTHEHEDAIDLSAIKGTEVYATHSGTISYGSATDYGLYIYIDSNLGWQTLYAHLLERDPNLSIGDYVQKGQYIGKVDSTGSTSTGNHLHYGFHGSGTCNGLEVNSTNFAPTIE